MTKAKQDNPWFIKLFESNNIGVAVTDPDGNLIEANDYYLKLIEYTQQELEQRTVNWEEFTPPEYLPIYRKSLSEVKEYGVCQTYEKEYRTRSGKRNWVLVTAMVHPFNESQIIAMVIDITDWKLSEIKMKNALEAAMNEMKRSNKDLEVFAYTASHDLQEPIRMIRSYAQLIKHKHTGLLNNEVKVYLDFIDEGAARMQHLVDGLLKFSRASTKPYLADKINCNLILEEVLKDLSLQIADADAKIIYADLPVVTGDEIQLRQLFQNIIQNAIKFRSEREPVIKVEAVRENGFWLFSVADNGIGIEKEYFDRIFVMFQRLHEREQYPGLGLGLALCKKIVERHGGEIYVESEPGKGTTFYFTLPA